MRTRSPGWRPEAEAFADRLAVGATAEIVVAAGAGGVRHDLDLAGVALELDHRLPVRVEHADVEPLASDRRACRRSSACWSRSRFFCRSDGVKSMPRVISSEPWSTRARPPMITYYTRSRSSSRTIAYGSKRPGLIARRSARAGAEALLRRQLLRLAHARVALRVALERHQGQREVEVAGLEDAAERREARLDRSASQRAIELRGIPSLSASSSCESPARSRAARISSPLVTARQSLWSKPCLVPGSTSATVPVRGDGDPTDLPHRRRTRSRAALPAREGLPARRTRRAALVQGRGPAAVRRGRGCAWLQARHDGVRFEARGAA